MILCKFVWIRITNLRTESGLDAAVRNVRIMPGMIRAIHHDAEMQNNLNLPNPVLSTVSERIECVRIQGIASVFGIPIFAKSRVIF